MAKRAKRRGASRVTTQIQDIVSGRSKLKLEAAFPLINTINPTGESLPEAEAAARYTLKAQLIDHVISSYGDHLTCALDPNDETIISIQRIERRTDACHIPLHALDDAAARWVRQQLDHLPLDEDDPPARAGSNKTRNTRASNEDLIAQARAALEAYDYELAQQRFEQAHAHQLEGALPALIEFYVDHLAADEEAILAVEGAGAKTLSDQGRCLAALAAARQGRADLALQWIEGVTEPRVGDVLAQLVRSALSKARLVDAGRTLETLTAQWPSHPERLALTDALEAARANERAPLENEAERMLDADAHNDALRLAQKILQRWPSSPRADRIVRKVAQHQKRAELEALLEEAQALEAARPDRAIDLLTQAASFGANVSKKIAALKAKVEAQRSTQTLERIQIALEGDRVTEALEAYLKLDPVERKKLHPRAEAIERLDAVLARSPRAKAAQLIAATCAWIKADAQIAQGEVERAEAILEPHAQLLKRVPRAKATLGDIERAKEAAIAQAIEARLNEAERAFLAGDARASHAALSQIRLKGLSKSQAQRRAALSKQVDRALTLEAREKDYSSARSQGALLQAREALEALLSQTQGDAHDRWSRTYAELEDEIRAQFKVCTVREGLGAHLLLFMETRSVYSDPIRSIDLSKEEVITVGVFGRWLFIAHISITDSRPRALTMLKSPAPLEFPTFGLEGDVLTVVGDGHVLRFCLKDERILSWLDVRSVLEPDERFEMLWPLRGGQFAWLEVYAKNRVHRLYLLDLERRRVHRSLGEVIMSVPIDRGALGAAIRFDKSLTLIDEQGRTIADLKIGRSISSIASHPKLEGRYIITVEMPTKVEGEEAIEVWSLDTEGNTKRLAQLEEAYFEEGHMLLTSSEENLVALLWRGEEGGQLTCWRLKGDALERISQHPAPKGSALYSDPLGRRAALITEGGRLLRLPLPDAAVLEPSGLSIATHPSLYRCEDPRERKAQVLAHTAMVRSIHPSDFSHWLRKTEKRYADDPEHLGLTAEAIATVSYERHKEVLALRKRILARHPECGSVALALAENAMSDSRFQEAIELLSPFQETPLATGQPMHFWHVLAVAHLRLGRAESAEACFEEARHWEGDCELDDWPQFASALRAKEALTLEGPPSVRALVAHVRAADAALREGDFPRVLELLMKPWVIRLKSRHILQRLAYAYLEHDAPGSPDRCTKTIVLAAAIEEKQREDESVIDTCLPARLPSDAIARAARFLED